jgi:hypothetical protein
MLDGCPAINLNTCGSVAPFNIPNVAANAAFIVCNTSPFVLGPEYTTVQDACCNLCSNVTVTKPDILPNPPSTVYYQDCITKQLVSVVLNIADSVSFCAVNGSWFVVESNSVIGVTNILVAGAC